MFTAWWKNDAGQWVKVHVAAFLAGPNRGWPCVVMYLDADKDKTFVCVALYEEGARVSRFRSR